MSISKSRFMYNPTEVGGITVYDLCQMKDSPQMNESYVMRSRFSPRSCETLNRSGITPREIAQVDFADYLQPGVKQAVAQIRYDLAVQAREQKFQVLVNEYKALHNEICKGKWSPERLLNNTIHQSSISVSQKGEGAAPKSTLIEQEKKAIERIKIKQQKEVEKMLQAEFAKQQIQKRNAEKAEHEKTRALAREQAAAEREELAAIKAAQVEQKRVEIQQREAAMVAATRAAADEKERQQREKAAIKEAERVAEIQRKEEERAAAHEAMMEEQARKTAEREHELYLRRQAMEERDRKRVAYMEQQRQLQQEETEAKRLQKEAQIEEARAKEAEMLQLQRVRFEEKDMKAQEKLQQFEYRRELERAETRRQAEAKAQKMLEVARQNELQEQQRKDDFYAKAAEVERRKQLKEIEHQKDLVKRKEEFERREQYIQDVRVNMEAKMQQRLSQIEKKRQEKDYSINEAMNRRRYEMELQKEHQNSLRAQRQDTVQRIMRSNEYHKDQILIKIEEENKRLSNLNSQKMELLNARRNMKDEAARQREIMSKKFEWLQNKGQFTHQTLAEFGISEERFNELQNSPGGGRGETSRIETGRGSSRIEKPGLKRSSMNEIFSKTQNMSQMTQPLKTGEPQKIRIMETRTRDDTVNTAEGVPNSSGTKTQGNTQGSTVGDDKDYEYAPQLNQTQPVGYDSERQGRFFSKNGGQIKITRGKKKVVAASQLRNTQQVKKGKNLSQVGRDSKAFSPRGRSRPLQPLSVSDSQNQAVESLAKRRDELNMELMKVLEEETNAEAARENTLKQTTDEAEKRRLEKIYGVERARASERIIHTSDRHDEILKREMATLGIKF